MRGQVFTVNDGKLILQLEACEEGGFSVTSPMDPELITQGETLEECFEMACDCATLLAEVRARYGVNPGVVATAKEPSVA